ncbi:MAG: hypothetical protein ABI442_12390 [Gemmatimonadaceae bacterium]
MKQQQQGVLDSFRRVQSFLDTHAADVGPLKDSAARTQLDNVVVQLTAHGNDQGTTDLLMKGQINREKAFVADLKTQHMQPIAEFSRAKLRGVPDFAALTKPVSGLPSKVLVRAARAMATAGAPYATALTEGGFPADTIAQLRTAADAVDVAITDRANTKVIRVGATKGIGEQVLLGREAVGMLKAVIGKQFAKDKTFLAAWRAAYRVVAKPGAVGSGSVLPAAGVPAVPTPAVPAVQSVKPAAHTTAPIDPASIPSHDGGGASAAA